MAYQPCLGRECKLGWKYNESINKLIFNKRACEIEWRYNESTNQLKDSKEKRRKSVREIKNKWEYFAYSLSASSIPCWVVF